MTISCARGPLERDKPWSLDGIEDVRRFLDRAWRLFFDDETDEMLPAVQDIEPDESASMGQAVKTHLAGTLSAPGPAASVRVR